MEIEKYKELKEEIRNKSFEKKYVSVDLILYYASFFGNAASVFFAFFLWFPSLLKTITMHVGDNGLTHGVAVVATIILLGMVEMLKRGVVGIFSSEYIQSGKKLSDKTVKGLAIFSTGLVLLSFYFSVNGAMEFSKTSHKQNVVVESSSKAAIDSLSVMWENDKKGYVAELQDLRKSNKEIREKRDNTPLEQRRTRNDYNALLHDNEKAIEANNNLIWVVDGDYKLRIAEIKKKEDKTKVQNQEADSSNVILFLIVSTFIEILIVVGVYFRQVYIHKAFYEAELLLEPIIKQRERYEYLLRLIYKDGDIAAEDQIISLTKLTEIVKKKGIAYNAKNVKEFMDTMSHMGAFNLVGNKRYALVSYEDAKKLLNSLENL